MYPIVQEQGLGKLWRTSKVGSIWNRLKGALSRSVIGGVIVAAVDEIIDWRDRNYGNSGGGGSDDNMRFSGDDLTPAEEAALDQWNDNLFEPKFIEFSDRYKRILEGTLNEIDAQMKIIRESGPVITKTMTAQQQISAFNGLLKQLAGLRASMQHNGSNLSVAAMNARSTYVEVTTLGLEKVIIDTLENFEFPLEKHTVQFKDESVSFGALTPFGLKISYAAVLFVAKGAIPVGSTITSPPIGINPHGSNPGTTTTTQTKKSNSNNLVLIALALAAVALFSSDKKK